MLELIMFLVTMAVLHIWGWKGALIAAWCAALILRD